MILKQKNVVHRENCNDGRNETKREREGTPTTEKGKTFGTVSAITTEANQNDDQIELGATANHEATANNGATANHEKTTFLELRDLMAKLEQINKKFKCSEEDRQMLKKEIRYYKNESLDNCFNLARATEENYNKCQTRWRLPTKREREREREREMSKKTCKK